MKIRSISTVLLTPLFFLLSISSFARVPVDLCIAPDGDGPCVVASQPTPHVYATGFDEDNIGFPANTPWKKIAKVWVDGNAMPLTDGTYPAAGQSIFVDDLEQIYVAGYEQKGNPVPNTLGRYSVATLWLDGNPIALSDGTRNAMARSVYVANGHSYVGGYDGSEGKVWMDGSVLYSHPNAVISTIFVMGQDIYYSGFNGSNYAFVWKNGIPLPADQQPTNQQPSAVAFANAIFVRMSGTTPVVYVAGTTRVSNIKTLATIWTNGTPTYLATDTQANGSMASEASAIFVKNSTVHVVGHSYKNYIKRATLWKNGTASVLSPSTTNAHATSVFVDNNLAVYVGGAQQNDSYSNYPNVGMIWKNGGVHYSTMQNYAHLISSVFVK